MEHAVFVFDHDFSGGSPAFLIYNDNNRDLLYINTCTTRVIHPLQRQITLGTHPSELQIPTKQQTDDRNNKRTIETVSARDTTGPEGDKQRET